MNQRSTIALLVISALLLLLAAWVVVEVVREDWRKFIEGADDAVDFPHEKK